MELSETEMYKITGGAFSPTIASIIGGIVVFILGTINGYTNPEKCNIRKE